MKATVVFMVLAIVVCAMVQKSEQFGLEMPSMPNLPSLPSAPKLPSLPSMPNLPGLPSMPNLPGLPSLPKMSDITSKLPSMNMSQLSKLMPNMPDLSSFKLPDIKNIIMSGMPFNATQLISKLVNIPKEVQITCSAGLTAKACESTVPIPMPPGMPFDVNVKNILSGNPFDLSNIVGISSHLPGVNLVGIKCCAGLK